MKPIKKKNNEITKHIDFSKEEIKPFWNFGFTIRENPTEVPSGRKECKKVFFKALEHIEKEETVTNNWYEKFITEHFIMMKKMKDFRIVTYNNKYCDLLIQTISNDEIILYELDATNKIDDIKIIRERMTKQKEQIETISPEIKIDALCYLNIPKNLNVENFYV